MIPKNRIYSGVLLSKCGLHINRPMSIIKVSKGLSLNDCYWVVQSGFDGSFEGWIRKIVVNVALNKLRDDAKRECSLPGDEILDVINNDNTYTDNEYSYTMEDMLGA